MRILVMGVSALVAVAAQAQTPACDQLKGELAARIDASGARGYALETVRAGTPVPPGAKAIGTCEAGRYKILYRRWAAASSADAVAVAPGPAPAAQAAAAQASAVPDAQVRRSTGARSARAGRAALAPASAAASQALAPSDGPAAAVPAGREPLKERRTAPELLESPRAAGPQPGPGRARDAPVGDRSVVEPARASDTVVAQSTAAPSTVAQPAPARPADSAVAKTSLARRTAGFLVEHWPWFLALVLLPLGAWFWSWLAYRRAYDAAGLPRGPKL